MGLPQPGFFASTTVIPVAVAKTAVLPPPPLARRIQRLSLTFSTSITFGAFAAGGCALSVASPPRASSIPRTIPRFMQPPNGHIIDRAELNSTQLIRLVTQPP